MKQGIQQPKAVEKEQRKRYNELLNTKVRKSCRGCAYRDHTTHTCDYIIAQGHRRPCPAEHCTVKDTKISRAEVTAMIKRNWNADCN